LPSDSDLLTDDASGPTVEVRCECEYTLRGSDPRCDTERTDEVSSVFPQDPVSPICRRAADVCRQICPRSIP
jgi:hypothetical protein